jgi:hypothetical protein
MAYLLMISEGSVCGCVAPCAWAGHCHIMGVWGVGGSSPDGGQEAETTGNWGPDIPLKGMPLWPTCSN